MISYYRNESSARMVSEDYDNASVWFDADRQKWAIDDGRTPEQVDTDDERRMAVAHRRGH